MNGVIVVCGCLRTAVPGVSRSIAGTALSTRQILEEWSLKLPKEIRDKFRRAGRKGGKKTGRKGLAAMPAEQRREIQAKAVKARRKKATT